MKQSVEKMSPDQHIRWAGLIYTMSIIKSNAEKKKVSLDDLNLKYSEIKRYAKYTEKELKRKLKVRQKNEIYTRV